MSQIYFLTGGAGFVGGNIVRKLLVKHCQVHLAVQKKTALWRITDLLKSGSLTLHNIDLLDEKKLSRLLKKIRPDIIYHLAAHGAYPTQNNARQILETNILGTYNLLAAADSIPYQLLVNTGSSSEYGFKDQPMSENDLLTPASYYAVAKAAATLLCHYEANAKKKPIVSLRLFSVYGPYEAPSRLMPTLMKSMVTGQTLSLVSPHTVRDFIYIDDVVDFYLNVRQLKKNVGRCFNLGTGKQTTLQEVVKTAEKISGQKLTCEWNKMTPRSWDTSCWQADTSQTQKNFQWQPKYNLAQGLCKMWQWWQKNQLHYD